VRPFALVGRSRLGAPALALVAAFALAGCGDEGRVSRTSVDSLGARAGGRASAPGDTSAARRTGWILAAKAYLDGWARTTAHLDSAAGVPDSTRDADVASAVVLGKAVEQHLYEAFLAESPGSPDPLFDAELRALHAARRATIEHYEAFLADGSQEELDLAIEGSAAEADLAHSLIDRLEQLAK
jgi:hypothetical protein